MYDFSRSVIDGRFSYIRNFEPQLPLIYRNAHREQIEMTRTLIELTCVTGGASIGSEWTGAEK